jgi:hypothetical protein
VALELAREVIDPVGDVRLLAQRSGDGAVGLEAQPLDVVGARTRARYPDTGSLDERLPLLPLVGDEPDVVEPRALERAAENLFVSSCS